MKQTLTFTISIIKSYLVIFITIAALLISLSASASQLYRYKDEAGSTVLNRTIPPELVKNGYDILNSKGRVIETVPPALTKAQIAARDAELERKKQQEAAAAEQKQMDAALLQLYSHPNDAVRILERKTRDIKGVIQFKEKQILNNEDQIVREESKAANIQRNGRAIPESLLGKIKSLNKEISTTRMEIEELKENMATVLSEFDDKIKRLELITNKEATDYAKLLESLGFKDDEPSPVDAPKTETPANP